MTNANDRITKENFFLQSLSVIERFLGLEPIVATQEIPEKLHHTLEREPDFVRIVTSEGGHRYILHLEFQSTNDPTMLKRMGEYHSLLLRRYDLPIQHHVLYFGASPPNMETTLEDDKIFTGFVLTNLQDFRAQDLIQANTPEEVVMAILGDFESVASEVIIDQILARLQQLTQELGTFNKYTTQLEVYSRLRKLEELTSEKVESMAVTIDFTKTTAYRRGEEKAKRDAEQNKIDSAKRMLADGELSIEQVARYADLTIQEVTEIKAGLGN
ncbi:MAG TPA: hypothetical protein DCE41_35270 [Cytophagales bacterium]|nr:hypothetical protein [Cytophagales bacterium]HAA24345.1 hypothetical protein [Cytophagales bacterium]HAP60139.1 hypothetical protein [Cytophagales bacterium]